MKAPGSEGAPERKRKRPHPDQPHLRQLNSGNSSDITKEAEGTTAKPYPATPGDEEVEAFFAILRRMHAAVKCYGKSGLGDGNGTRRWTPLPVPSLNGGASKVKKTETKTSGQANDSVGFDLNVVPAEASEANGD